MAISIPFNVIAPSTLVPGFFFEVHPYDNTGLQQFQTLLIGQVLDTGSLAAINATTSAVTATDSDVLTFTTGIAKVTPGMSVYDVTTPDAIPAGATVVSKTSTTVTLSTPITDLTGVGSGDSIRFTPPPGPILITSKTQAIGAFGAGSMLANMVIAYRDIDNFGTLYCLPLHDDPAAVAATGSLSILGTATATGNIPLYVNGQYIPVLVTTSMTNADIAVAVKNSINAAQNIPVVVAGSTFPLTLTALNKGLVGNGIDVRMAYYGPLNGEAMPVGLSFTGTTMTGGSLNPNLDAPLAALGTVPFDLIAGPYSDATSLDSISLFLNDISGRWSPFVGSFGHYFVTKNDTVATLTTLAIDRNDQHLSLISNYKSPTSDANATAMVAANASISLRVDPGVPLNTLELLGALAPQPADQATVSERQTLLADGCGTLRTAPGNHYVIDRIVTSYTADSYGYPDTSFQNVEKMYCIAYAAKYFGSQLSSQFSRVKLAHDGSRVPVGSSIVTPSVIKGTCISAYGDLCDLGIMDGGSFDAFAQNCVVQINATNRNMVDISLPITPVHQLDTVRIALQLVL